MAKSYKLEDIGGKGGLGERSVDVVLPGKIRHVLPTLYIPRANRITEWIVFCIQDSDDPDTWYISTKSRVWPDGKWKIEEAKMVANKNVGRKNQRLGEDQALAEAQSKFDLKVRKGHGTEDIEEAQEFFDNEGAGKVDKYSLQPMLGKDIQEKGRGSGEKVFAEKRLHYPVTVQKKINGLHQMAFYDEKLDEVVMISRTGKKFTVFPHMREALLPWFRKHPNIILDGELYSHDTWSFQALSGIARKEKIKELTDEQKEALPKIIIYLFDYLDLDNMDMVYTDRMAAAEEELAPFLQKLEDKGKYVPIEILEYYEATSKKQIDKIYKKFLEEGYEGAMIRNDMPFIFGKRVSDRLFKYKPQFDDEFKLIGYEEGTGKFANTPIWVFQTKEGKEFRSTPTGTLEDRKEIFDELQTKEGQKKYFNKKFTVYFYGWSEDRIPIQSNVDTPPMNKHAGGI